MARKSETDDVGEWNLEDELVRGLDVLAPATRAAGEQPTWWTRLVLGLGLAALIFLVIAGAPGLAYVPLTVLIVLGMFPKVRRRATRAPEPRVAPEQGNEGPTEQAEAAEQGEDVAREEQ